MFLFVWIHLDPYPTSANAVLFDSRDDTSPTARRTSSLVFPVRYHDFCGKSVTLAVMNMRIMMENQPSAARQSDDSAPCFARFRPPLSSLDRPLLRRL